MKAPTAGPARTGSLLPVIAFGALLMAMTPPAARAVSPSISPWETIVSVDSTEGTESDHFPEIVASGQTLHMAWTSDINYDRNFLCYRRSLDSGVTWENRIVLQDYGNDWPSLQTGAATRLAVDGNHIHIVQRRLIGGWHYEIDYFRSTDGGATFEAKRTLASSDQYWVFYTPRVAAANGTVVVAFNRNPNWYYNPAGLLMISTNNGTSFTTKTILAGTGAGCMDLRHDGNRLASIWRNQNGVWAVCSDDNGTTINEVKISSTTGDAQDPDPAVMRPQLCAINDEIVHMAWVQHFERTAGNWQRAMFYARSTDGGATFETARNLTEGTIGTDQVRGGGRASLVARGSRVHAAFVTEAGGFWLRSSDDTGETFGNPVPLHIEGSNFFGNGDYPHLALDPSDENGATVWFACAVLSGFGGCSSNIVGHSTDGGKTIDPVLAPAHPRAWGNFTPYCFQLIPIMAESGTLWSLHYVGVRPGYDADLFFRPLDPPPDPSMENQALHLDPEGVRNDQLQVPSIGGLDDAGFTIEAWVRLTNGIDHPDPVEILQWGDHINGLSIRTLRDGGGKHYFSAFHGTTQVGGTREATFGAWHHLALTYDPADSTVALKFYQDGTLAGSAAPATPFQTILEPIFIGGSRSLMSFVPLHGDVDNLRFHARPLSREELLASASTDEVTGAEDGLSAAFGFDGTAMDVTGNGHDGLLQFGADFMADPGRPAADIAIEQPAGSELVSGANRSFGACAIGTGTPMVFTVRNTGGTWLGGIKVTKSGNQAADFTLTSPADSTLGPGEATTFGVIFKPSAKGVRKAKLLVTSNDPDEGDLTINLSGSGIQAPEIAIEQPTGSGLVDGKAKKNFGIVKVGESGISKVFTIKNTGSADLTGLAATKDGANAADFTVGAPAKTTLKPGEKTTFKVTFKPKAKGVRNAAVHLKSNDADENPFDIKLAGAGG